MDCLLGITGNDFVLLAADTQAARSIVVMGSESQKFRHLNTSNALAFCGESGDTTAFADLIQANVKLHGIRGEGIEMGTEEIAHYVRKQLADSLRSRSPYQVNLLIGGIEPEVASGNLGIQQAQANKTHTPRLYWIDYLGAMTEVPFAAHGYASYFCLSTLDRHYRAGMNLEQAKQVLMLCLQELKTRFIVNLPSFALRIVRADGIREELISL